PGRSKCPRTGTSVTGTDPIGHRRTASRVDRTRAQAHEESIPGRTTATAGHPLRSCVSAPEAQLAEATDSKPVQCEFESHRGHSCRSRPTWARTSTNRALPVPGGVRGFALREQVADGIATPATRHDAAETATC